MTNDLAKGDVWHALTKAAIGAVPFLGPPVSELFQLAIATPAQLRQAQWEASVTEVLNRLITNVAGSSVESLANNGEFLTTVIAASQIAMKTSQIEKIRMLQSAIYNSGSGLKLENFIQNTFLQIIERYVPEHVVLLTELANDVTLKRAFTRLVQQRPDLVSIGKSGPPYGANCKIENLAQFILEDFLPDTTSELFADLHRDNLCLGSEGFQLSYYVEAPMDFVTPRGTAFLEYISLKI